MKSFSRIAKLVTGVMMGLLVIGFTGCATTYNVVTDFDNSLIFRLTKPGVGTKTSL